MRTKPARIFKLASLAFWIDLWSLVSRLSQPQLPWTIRWPLQHRRRLSEESTLIGRDTVTGGDTVPGRDTVTHEVIGIDVFGVERGSLGWSGRSRSLLRHWRRPSERRERIVNEGRKWGEGEIEGGKMQMEIILFFWKICKDAFTILKIGLKKRLLIPTFVFDSTSASTVVREFPF